MKAAIIAFALIVGCSAAAASDEQRPSEVISAPWSRSCFNSTTPGKLLCHTYQKIDWVCDRPAGSISLYEGPNESRLDISLRGRMNMTYGARISIDDGPRLYTGPLVHCFPDACTATYPASPELISQLKSGRALMVEAMDSVIRPVTIAFSLEGFADGYDQKPPPSQFTDEERELLVRGQWFPLLLKLEQRPTRTPSCNYREYFQRLYAR